jgi:hypothetical protein
MPLYLTITHLQARVAATVRELADLRHYPRLVALNPDRLAAREAQLASDLEALMILHQHQVRPS